MIKKRQRMIPMKQNSESNENVCPGYYYYDSKLATTPEELQDLYRFTRWGRSRSLEQIEKMLEGTSMCFSVGVTVNLLPSAVSSQILYTGVLSGIYLFIRITRGKDWVQACLVTL